MTKEGKNTHQEVILRGDSLSDIVGKITKKFKISDTFQQMVGGLLLAGPFIVTEEVWRIASNMRLIQFLILMGFNLTMAYVALYKADKTRDSSVEQDIYGVPYRFISLVVIAIFSVTFLSLVIGANTTFEASWSSFVYAMAISSTFSIIGAATADSIF